MDNLTQDKDDKDEITEQFEDIGTSSNQFESEPNTISNCFFSSSDEEIKSLDDFEIISRFTIRYPEFNQSTKDLYLRKYLLVILNDRPFITSLLKYYGLNINDLIIILNKFYGSLFNAGCIKKVRVVLELNDYDAK